MTQSISKFEIPVPPSPLMPPYKKACIGLLVAGLLATIVIVAYGSSLSSSSNFLNKIEDGFEFCAQQITDYSLEFGLAIGGCMLLALSYLAICKRANAEKIGHTETLHVIQEPFSDTQLRQPCVAIGISDAPRRIEANLMLTMDAWKDGVVVDVKLLHQFIEKVAQIKKNGPLPVYANGGVGRGETFAICYEIYQKYRQTTVPITISTKWLPKYNLNAFQLLAIDYYIDFLNRSSSGKKLIIE